MVLLLEKDCMSLLPEQQITAKAFFFVFFLNMAKATTQASDRRSREKAYSGVMSTKQQIVLVLPAGKLLSWQLKQARRLRPFI